MKKILFLMMVLFNINANAQYFTLSKNGLHPSNDPTKKFIVIEKEGKNQSELFKQIKDFITENYVSPKDVMSENGNEMITLNAVSDGDVQCKVGFAMLPLKTNYSITFMFKDGKIRVNTPSINSMLGESYTIGGQLSELYELVYTDDDQTSPNRKTITIFKKNGKTTKGAKESIELFFNTLIDKAVNYKSNNNEDW